VGDKLRVLGNSNGTYSKSWKTQRKRIKIITNHSSVTAYRRHLIQPLYENTMKIFKPKQEPEFRFYPKWKEELICEYHDHKFIIEMTMGVSNVYFPTEEVWNLQTPEWGKGIYQNLIQSLNKWCESKKIPLTIEPNAWVEFDK